MNKKHLLWWMFDFLQREHPDALADMRGRMVGDVGEAWVKAALAERLDAFEEARPAGYKFLAEYRREGTTLHKDLVVYDSDRRIAEEQAEKLLAGASKMDMLILSDEDLKQLKLQPGQMRTADGIMSLR